MGLVNTVVPLEQLEEETVRWCREMLELSPFALRLLKASFNAAEDGLAGHPAAGARRQPPLLRERGGAGGPRRLPGEAPARTSGSSPSGRERRSRDERRHRAAHSGCGCSPRGRARCRPRSRRCWSAPRWPRPRTTSAPLPFVAALIGSVFIQIGTNLSNDYSDARRGADTEERLGPVRVTAGGLMPPRRVLVGTYVAFGIAVAAGALPGGRVAGWELLVVGAASILAGVLYTGGPRPYGYEGLGELFVFVFFGLVAVVGSYYVQTEDLRWEAFALGGAGRPARLGDPGGEQRARHRHRPPRRASARSRCGSAATARALLYAAMVMRRLRGAGGHLGIRRPERLAAADARGAAAGSAADRDGLHAHRRAGAERRAGGHRPAAGGLLAAARPPACCCREADACCGSRSRSGSRS